MKKILVSACLYGECTRYDGKNNILKNPFFLKWKNRGILVSVCPEVLGGLPTPRLCSEICGGRVVNSAGDDVTAEFEKGAQRALEIAKENDVLFAILKQSSPSCGCRFVYDGTFSGKKIPGMGVTAAKLVENGITVFDENDTGIAHMFYTHAAECRGKKNSDD